MKRILLLILIFTMLICSFSIPSYAAESKGIDQSSVEEDLKSKYTNLEEHFPVKKSDNKIYLISLLEYGYSSSVGERSYNYGLYLYVYNPSGKDINTDMNMVQFATRWKDDGKGNVSATDFKKYALNFLDVNATKTLLKFKVHSPDSSMIYKFGNSRRYDISGIEMHEKEYTYEDYEAGYSYTFTGYGKGMSPQSQESSTLSCELGSFLTLKVEAHQVSYLTGDSALDSNAFKNYSNQINSVYFSIPSDIEDKYGDLYSIKYEYYHYYTSPIIVTNNKESYNILKSDIGKIADNTWDYRLSLYTADLSGYYTVHFNYGKPLPSMGASDDYKISLLTSVFPYSGNWKKGDIVVSADDLQAYFRQYNSSYHTGKVFDYSADLFDLEKSKGYVVEETNVNDEFTMDSYADSHGWFEAFFNGIFDLNKYDETVNANFIQLVDSDVMNSDASKNYLVSSSELSGLQAFYSFSSSLGDNVYLLRYGAENNYCSMDLVDSTLDGDFLMAQGNVYLNFDFIYFTFGDAENHTVIAAVSDPTDGFFDVTDTTPDDFDWALLLKYLKIILAIFLLVLIACVVIFVVIPLLQVVFGVTSSAGWIISKPFQKINEKRDRDNEK